jgi:hypothetical protein
MRIRLMCNKKANIMISVTVRKWDSGLPLMILSHRIETTELQQLIHKLTE